jgi:hypothetical protein
VVGYQGGYFKYGTLSWQQTKIEANGITVKFTLKTAWKSAFFSRCAAARARARARAPPAFACATRGRGDVIRCAGARAIRRGATA